MLGKHESCGLIPSAVAWLYRCVSEQRQRTTAKYGIRVSVVEVTNRKRDLLASYASGKLLTCIFIVFFTLCF